MSGEECWTLVKESVRETKVLFCEKNFEGHRRIYLSNLTKINGLEAYAFAPENTGIPSERFYLYQGPKSIRKMADYFRWIFQIRKIVLENQIDVVHFLDGDSIMRFFGLGFHMIGAAKLMITYHHFFEGKLRKISYQMMNRGRNTTSVVHTETVQNQLNNIGLQNVELCRYPAFEHSKLQLLNTGKCKKNFALSDAIPTIGIIGGMCRYKNIIPFLNSLKKCEKPFRLLLCGSQEDISKQEIEKSVEPYAEYVTLRIKYLTDEEYLSSIAASDIIYALYSKEFDGASGPLTDGVCAGKMILACDHGSLGEIVRENELGFTADCDNEEDILQKTEAALERAGEFSYSPKAKNYAESLKPEAFQKRYMQIYQGSCET